jgi:hypothetical protein
VTIRFPTPAEVRTRRAAIVKNVVLNQVRAIGSKLETLPPTPDGTYLVRVDTEFSSDVWAAFQEAVGDHWTVVLEAPKLSHGDKQWSLIFTPRDELCNCPLPDDVSADETAP